MAYVLKAAINDVKEGDTLTVTVPAMYGGADAGRGDDVFVWASGQPVGTGLAFRGALLAKRKSDGEFQVSVQLKQMATRILDNGDLADFRDSTLEDGISGVSRKLFRHSHDKLAALSETEASFLSQYFDPRPSAVFGTIPFERGKVYNRRADIHTPFGGQEQSGITTPKNSSFIFLFTGEEGGRYGYRDETRADGLFEYTGEGQTGDMQFVRGNKAVRDHIVDGKELLLFRTLKKKGLCQYLGSYLCVDYLIRSGTDKNNVARDTIVFLLTPVENLHTIEEDMDTPSPTMSLEDMRKAAYSALATQTAPKQSSSRNIYLRSRAVRDYVLRRANGICERCKLPAPFLRGDGTPYLEPHHTRRVSDGGPDHPRWVGAICPSCHRHIHYGQNGIELNEELQQYLGQLEKAN